MDCYNSPPNSFNSLSAPTPASFATQLNPNVSGIGPIPVAESFNGTGPFFSAAEIEFMAESTLITIKPLMKLEDLDLLSGKFGPFRVGKPVQVPLWLAIVLRKGNNCTIVPPPWMSLNFLNEALDREKSNRDEYFALPEHYLEISLLLLESAAADIADNEQVRLKVQCLREIRHQKTLAGLKEIDGDPIKLNHMSRMELNEIRPFLLPSMDRLVLLRRAKQEERTHSIHQQSQ